MACFIHEIVNSGWVIQSFGDQLTEKVFLGTALSKKERQSIGALNLKKATERLAMLHTADEKSLMTAPFLHYHSLVGTDRYSIDADSRNSKWRITFRWENEEMADVEMVRIEDTH
jgi:plasmid maintenance system killer protein